MASLVDYGLGLLISLPTIMSSWRLPPFYGFLINMFFGSKRVLWVRNYFYKERRGVCGKRGIFVNKGGIFISKR